MTSNDLLNDEATNKNWSRAYQPDKRHVFHSWSAQEALAPVVVTETNRDLTSSHQLSIINYQL